MRRHWLLPELRKVSTCAGIEEALDDAGTNEANYDAGNLVKVQETTAGAGPSICRSERYRN